MRGALSGPQLWCLGRTQGRARAPKWVTLSKIMCTTPNRRPAWCDGQLHGGCSIVVFRLPRRLGQPGLSRAASARCFCWTRLVAQAAQIAAGTHPTRLACRPKHTSPGTGRSIAKKARPGTIATVSRRMSAVAPLSSHGNRLWACPVTLFRTSICRGRAGRHFALGVASDPRLRPGAASVPPFAALPHCHVLPRLVCRMARRSRTSDPSAPARERADQAWALPVLRSPLRDRMDAD